MMMMMKFRKSTVCRVAFADGKATYIYIYIYSPFFVLFGARLANNHSGNDVLDNLPVALRSVFVISNRKTSN